MIRHHAPGEQRRPEALPGLLQHAFEGGVVLVRAEEPRAAHGPIQHVIGKPRLRDSRISWHGRIPAKPPSHVNKDSRPLYSCPMIRLFSDYAKSRRAGPP